MPLQTFLNGALCHHNEEEEKMKTQLLVCSSILFTILFCFQITPQAKQQAIDVTLCVAGTCDNLSEAEDMETKSCEARGIGWSNNDFKLLETFATFEKCILGIKNDKWDMDCFMKWLDSDGDYIVFRNKKIYGGTGKWKEATGDRQSKRIRRAQSMPPNNFALCTNSTGSFEIPE